MGRFDFEYYLSLCQYYTPILKPFNPIIMTTTKKKSLPIQGYSLLQAILKTGAFLKSPVTFVQQSMDKFGDSYSAVLPGNRNIIWTQNPEFIDHVLRINQRNYIKSEFIFGRASDFFGKGLVFSKGEYWRKQRRLIQPAFHRKKLMGLYGIMIKTIQEVVAEIPTGKPIDMYPLMSNLSFRVLVNSLFDISLSKELVDELNQLFNDLQVFLMDETNRPYQKLLYPFNGAEKKQHTKSERLRAIMQNIIQERRASNHDFTDILDTLLNSTYEDTGEYMHEDQVIDELLVLLFAGFETTSNTLSWLLFLLADNKEVTKKLVTSLQGTNIEETAQNEYLKATIHEAMRLYPAAWMTERVVLKDDTIGDYVIPAGTHIMTFFYGLHRNEKLWDTPDEFQPERFLKDGKVIKAKGFFPFGVGPRMCIGNHFALAEIMFFVHAFFEKFDVETTGQIPEMNPLLTLQPNKVILNIKKR